MRRNCVHLFTHAFQVAQQKLAEIGSVHLPIRQKGMNARNVHWLLSFNWRRMLSPLVYVATCMRNTTFITNSHTQCLQTIWVCLGALLQNLQVCATFLLPERRPAWGGRWYRLKTILNTQHTHTHARTHARFVHWCACFCVLHLAFIQMYASDCIHSTKMDTTL